MKAPACAISLGRTFEGFSARPYLCPAGYWTIAYGRRCGKDHPAVSREEGEAYLAEDMATATNAAVRICPVLAVQNERILGAVADFVFNLGAGKFQASTLRRRIERREWPEAVDELNRWVYGGGRKLPGLVLRRAAEAALIREGVA